jgi:hypothetical protein
MPSSPLLDPLSEKTMKAGFTPIKLNDYVELYLHANSGTVRANVVRQLESTIRAVRTGARCQCGEQIWIIGSAHTGLGCFRCITGQTAPDHDYEINVHDEDTAN